MGNKKVGSQTPKQQQKEQQSQQAVPDAAKLKANEALQKRFKKSTPIYEKYGNQIAVGLVVFLICVALINPLFQKKKNLETDLVLDQEEIKLHNLKNESFNLGENEQFKGMVLSEAKDILNAAFAHSGVQSLLRCPTSDENEIIPEEYNFREKFSECARPIYTQENCASSYALATAGAISDRICQQTGQDVVLSPQPLIACSNGLSYGCQGGYVTSALQYAKINGLPETTCMSYNPSAKKTDCGLLNNCPVHKITEQCILNEEEYIKKEILNNGPVITVIPVYVDFLSYKNGIYEVLEGVPPLKSGQAIKIIGWGVQPVTDKNYWIIENFWGESWGENGLGYIYTNSEELQIESQVIVPVTQLI